MLIYFIVDILHAFINKSGYGGRFGKPFEDLIDLAIIEMLRLSCHCRIRIRSNTWLAHDDPLLICRTEYQT